MQVTKKEYSNCDNFFVFMYWIKVWSCQLVVLLYYLFSQSHQMMMVVGVMGLCWEVTCSCCLGWVGLLHGHISRGTDCDLPWKLRVNWLEWMGQRHGGCCGSCGGHCGFPLVRLYITWVWFWCQSSWPFRPLKHGAISITAAVGQERWLFLWPGCL